MDDTTITLHRTGGIVATMKSATVALSKIPAAERKRWEGWVRDFLTLTAKKKSPQPERTALRDASTMSLEVTRPAGTKSLHFDERSIPQELLPLVSELARQLKVDAVK